MKILSFENFLKMEKRRLFSLSKIDLKEMVKNFDTLLINQQIFLKFYLYYSFQIHNRRITKKEYLIIKEYLDKYPNYQDVINLYKEKPNDFIDVIKNLKNYDLYKKGKIILGIKLKAFREALNDKETRINFIKKTRISSPAVTRFRHGTDYAISNDTFTSDSQFMNKVRPIFHKIKNNY